MSPLACGHSRYEQRYTNTIDLYWYSINYHLYMPDASEFSLPLPDIRRLEQFVAVAESDTLADAATRVFVTQQALSTAIRRLENELGVSLFNREHRGLTLTPAGEDLLRNARAILTGARHLTRSVRAVAQQRPPVFVVGHSPALSGAEVFSIVESAVQRHEDIPVTARPVFPAQFVDDLLQNRVDLVLRRGIDTPSELISAVIGYQELRLAVTIDHPLATLDRISMSDVAEHPVIVWAPERHSYYTDFLVAHCRRSGFEPILRINRVQGTPPTTAVLVDTTACAFVTAPAGPAHGGRVMVKEFTDPPLSPIQALWLPHTVSDFRTAILNSAPARLSPEGA
ncbi:LysR family transcriptional regulator [Gordonia polyisoprenivorans]|uniref:LysR family transcriptional regulator n=1 Tax=Gordonia polyisoprenivorans TaxID=84595 RepID=UPI0023004171|nr:LysR family transcriptional regulator [Gordonia polyisoprenivorans]WCB35696.1 LysR family transcriptional regulator [Gordonia polyisoprenivorans]